MNAGLDLLGNPDAFTYSTPGRISASVSTRTALFLLKRHIGEPTGRTHGAARGVHWQCQAVGAFRDSSSNQQQDEPRH